MPAIRPAEARAQQLPRRLDGGVAVLAAGEDLVIAVRDRPALAETARQLLGVRPCAEGVGIDVMQRRRQAGDADRCPVGGVEAVPRRDSGPDIAHQRALDRVRVGARDDQRRAGRDRAGRLRRRQSPQRRDGSRRADRREAAMRVQHEVRESEGARHPRRRLVAENQRAQQVACPGAGRLGLGQQRGQAVEASVADHAAIAAVELAPVAGSPVRQRRRVAVEPHPAGVEDGRLGRAGALRHLALQRRQFGLVAGSDHGGEVVRQHQRGATADGLGDVGPLDGGAPLGQRHQPARDGLGAHSAAIRAADSRSSACATGMTSAYFAFMSHRLTACEVGLRS